MTTAADIFLSYNREDHATARRFAEAFEREGFSVWWDATLRSGEAYDEVTENALRQAKAVVVLWSKKSVVSRWVRAEATIADRNKTLVPAMIEPCQRPIMFELTQTAELGHWQGADYDKAWVAFLDDVRRFVEKDQPVAEPASSVEPSSSPSPAAIPGERGDAPLIAVLPFTNRSGLAEDDVFAIGMVEDIIEALSQGVNVHVLASSATSGLHKGGITDPPAIAKALGVRYLLEGNVRRTGASIRVTSQLIEAASGAVLWTQRFERPLSELAALQEDLVLEVASNLDAQVYRIEIERALKKPADLTAWEAVTRSAAAYRLLNGESMLRAVEEAKRAVAIAPDYGLAHATLALADSLIYIFLTPDSPDEVRRIRGHAERAIALDPNNALVLAKAAEALCYIGRVEAALHPAERAVSLSPSLGYVHFVLGLTYCLPNRYDEAVVQFDADLRLSPGDLRRYATYGWQAIAHIRAERWHDAMNSIGWALALEPNFSYAVVLKGIICHHDGRAEEAREAMAQAREIEPETPLGLWELRYSRFFVRAPNWEELLRHLRMAWADTESAA